MITDPIIVSVHVPKCAGTSFRLVLEALYGSRLWPNYGTVFTRAQARPDCVPVGTGIVHGHFLADAFDEVLPGAPLITWVRHPVERVISNYHHYLRSPDFRDECCRQLHAENLSLLAFAEIDWMRNLTTRYLAGKPFEAFAAVGVAERFSESLTAMAESLDWPPLSLCPRVNTNPARRAERYELPRDVRDYIGYLNAADLAWYEQAVAALDSRTGAKGTGRLNETRKVACESCECTRMD